MAATEGADLEQLRAALAADPAEPQRRYALARALSHAGAYAEALALYAELTSRFPEDADYWLGYGQTLLWSGQPTEAVAALERALTLAPDYADVVTTLAQARQALAESSRADPSARSPDPAWAAAPAVRLDQARPDFFLAASHAQEDPSNQPRNWQDSDLELTARFAPRTQVGARAIASSRFGLSDSTYGFNGYYALTRAATAHAEVLWSPTHRVRPRDTWRAALTYGLPAGFVVAAGYRQSRYTESDVEVLDGTIERYFSAYRVAYTLYHSDSDTAGTAWSHQFHGSWYYRDDASLNLSIAFGDEVEKTLTADTVTRTAFEGIALWGESWMTPDFALTYALGFTDLSTDQGVDFDRKAFNVGAKFRF